jgi:glutathione S-transferase
MSILANSKFTYFNVAGKGDAPRLALAHGGIPFTDNRVAFPDWAALKPSTPFGQLPIIRLADGTVLSQQRAILRLIGKETGLYPTDALAAARVDEFMDALDGLSGDVNDVGRGLEPAEKEAARKEAVTTGKVFDSITKLNDFIKKNGTNGHAVGDSLTVADFLLAVLVSVIVSGWFDGVPTTAFAPFSEICAVRKTVGALETTKKYYAGLSDADKVKYSRSLLAMDQDFE